MVFERIWGLVLSILFCEGKGESPKGLVVLIFLIVYEIMSIADSISDYELGYYYFIIKLIIAMRTNQNIR